MRQTDTTETEHGAGDTQTERTVRTEGGGARLFSGPRAYRVRTPWQAVAGTGAAIAIFGGATLAVVLAVIGVWLLEGGDFKAVGDNVMVQLGATLVQQGVMVGLTLWAASRYGGSMADVLALRRPAQGAHIYLVAFMVFLAAMISMSLISNAISPESNQADVGEFKKMFASPLWPLALFVVGVGAPVAEELLFRGFLFPALANSQMGVWGAAVLTSLIFAVVHPYSFTGRIEVFAIGLLLAWLLVRTGSLRVTMFAHSLNNTIQALLMLAGADSWM